MNVEPWLNDLTEKGYAVLESPFPDPLVRELSRHAQSEMAAGRFRPAGIGKGSMQDDSVRRDQILWWDSHPTEPCQRDLLAALSRLRDPINRTLFMGLNDWEGHYSLYPPGAFYRRHMDRFKRDDRRALSFLLYLNPDWHPTDGGALRLHLREASLSLAPRMGRCVVFLSDEILHEVEAPVRDRWSIAGWFRRLAP